MEAFLVSAGLVAIAEIGDKTQLLAMILAARYHKPVPIILGIVIPFWGVLLAPPLLAIVYAFRKPKVRQVKL